ncbi:MAG: hypothetical protein GY889_14470 [Proteobacteria bacterium]|nr:hypothetical protein [Pseudomonadota bacterium]
MLVGTNVSNPLVSAVDGLAAIVDQGGIDAAGERGIRFPMLFIASERSLLVFVDFYKTVDR